MSMFLGVYRKPSLSAQPGPLVKSEGNMTLHCRSEIQFGSFVLHSEELSKAPWHLPGQPHREGSHANFIMGPVTAAHAGTYRCFGFLNHSFYEWSTPSDLLDIMITGENESHNLLCIHIFLQVTPDTCMFWLGPLVAIVFLTILLFFLTHRWCHATKSESWEEEASFHLSRDPPAEDAQEVTYTESGHCIFTQQKTTPTSQGPKEHSSDASVYMEFVRPIKA
uniref:Ig-like domain-containing protein n=1 Tax=Felis catus TaxID=9685 RepID=A0ABI8ALE9_FELCA